MPNVLTAVQLASTRALYSLLSNVLTEVEVQIPALSRAKMDVITAFIDNVNTDFQNIGVDPHAQMTVDSAALDINALTLVDDEQLEAQLAIEGMVAYSRNEHLPHYIALNTRLNSLFANNPVDESTNPLDPEQIANAFTAALRQLKLVGTQTLTVYREFNKGVLRKLDQVLANANQVMIDEGVIPDLSVMGINKPAYRSRTTRPKEADDTLRFGQQERARQSDGGTGGDQAELFSMLRSLLHPLAPGTDTGAAGGAQPERRDDGLVRRGAAGRVSQLQTGEPGEIMEQGQLLSALTQIQKSLAQRQTPEQDAEERVVVDEAKIHRPLAQTLQEAQQEGKIRGVDQNSSDVINLVSMLYNVIRDDQTVPRRINDLIDRTQISIAKVALTDTSFFDNDNHPARQLLNEFANASVGWTEGENFRQDPLYKKISSSVDRILTEHDQNDDLFEELLTDFRAFREEEGGKTLQAQRAAPKSQEGDVRAREAQDLVDRTIAERILGRELEPFTEELLQGPWHRFMVLLALKESPASKAWKHAVTTLDVLLWTMQPHKDEDDRKRLEAINPRLLNNLRKALKIASLDYPVIDALIDRVRDLQEASFPAVVEKKAPVARAAPERAPAVQAAEPEIDEATAAEVDSIIAAAVEHPASTVTEFAAKTNSAAESVQAAEVPEPKKDRDEAAAAREAAVTAPGPVEPEPLPAKPGAKAPAPAEAVPVAAAVQAEARYLTQVDDLAVGTWVEFQTGESETTRCKLAAKITAIDKLIFVNRQGIKVVETTRDSLALELQDGTVRVISDGQLFSRALEAVIGELREAQHAQQTGGAYHAAAPA